MTFLFRGVLLLLRDVERMLCIFSFLSFLDTLLFLFSLFCPLLLLGHMCFTC